MQIARAIHKSDSLSWVNGAFRKFQDLLSVTRGSTESMINFESRFDAALCRLNAVCKDSQLPDTIFAFLVLSHAHIDTSQRISILASLLSKDASSSSSSALQMLHH